MMTPHGKQIKMLESMSLRLTGERRLKMKKRSTYSGGSVSSPQRAENAENCKLDEHVSVKCLLPFGL